MSTLTPSPLRRGSLLLFLLVLVVVLLFQVDVSHRQRKIATSLTSPVVKKKDTAALVAFVDIENNKHRKKGPVVDVDVKHDASGHKSVSSSKTKEGVDSFGEGDNAEWKDQEEATKREKVCDYNLDLLWQTDVGSPIATTPVITDMWDSDGHREVLVSTLNHYVEVVEGRDGHRVPGWPFTFPSSSFTSSPLLYDIDDDGHQEVLVVTNNAEVVFLRDSGLPLRDHTFKIPPLRVSRDWYTGLEGPSMVASYALYNSESEFNAGSIRNPAPPLRNSGGSKRAAGKRTVLQYGGGGGGANGGGVPLGGGRATAFDSLNGQLTDAGIESLDLFLNTDTPDGHLQRMWKDGTSMRMNVLKGKETHHDQPPADDEAWREWVWVDAHVLATPVIADLEGDGHDELIIPVSYYYDAEKYANDVAARQKLPQDIKMDKYVGNGIVVLDLTTKEVKWTVNLDLTTDRTGYRGYIYSSPTVVDLNMDGTLEIVIGTGVGYIYVISSEGRIFLDGFPVMMDSIFAEVVVDDVDKDGKLDIIGMDVNSNVVCYDLDGKEVWETRISGYPNEPASVGDVNGDGIVDIVIGSSEGHVWALSGDTGVPLKYFPVLLRGRVYSQPLLVNLAPERGPTPQIVVHATDGRLYVINAKAGCSYKLDVGESSRTMVLADDLTGNGKMNLLLSTVSGQLICIETNADYHPLRRWTNSNHGHYLHSHSDNYHGIYLTDVTRDVRDVSGSTFKVQFEIVDTRYPLPHDFSFHYDVKITLGSNEVLFSHRYAYPGVYTEYLATPSRMERGVIVLHMSNEFGQRHVDSMSIGFNMHFYRWIKYVVALPVLTIVVAVFLGRKLTESSKRLGEQ